MYRLLTTRRGQQRLQTSLSSAGDFFWRAIVVVQGFKDGF